jgi:hypothetical protein
MAEVTCSRRRALFCWCPWHSANGGVVQERSRRIEAGRERERDTLACIFADACKRTNAGLRSSTFTLLILRASDLQSVTDVQSDTKSKGNCEAS